MRAVRAVANKGSPEPAARTGIDVWTHAGLRDHALIGLIVYSFARTYPTPLTAEPMVCGLAAGGEWIRKFSSAMPRHRPQRGRLHSTVSGGSSSRRNSSIGL